MKIQVDNFGQIYFFPLTEPEETPGRFTHSLTSLDMAVLDNLTGRPVWVPDVVGDLAGPGHIEEVEPVPVVPSEITFGQAHAAMRMTPHGEGTVLDAVQAVIDSLRGSNEPAHIVVTSFWDARSNMLRNSPSVVALGAQLGLTDALIDQLFTLAHTLNA